MQEEDEADRKHQTVKTQFDLQIFLHNFNFLGDLVTVINVLNSEQNEDV